MNNMIAGAGGCFRKGALVQLEGGKTKPIEELQIGDEVLSFDEYGIVTKSKVVETHYHPDPEPLLKVRFWQGQTYITPNHWVLNAIKSFSAMGDLGIGEALVDGFGNLRPIISVENAEAEPVYNLTVEPYHTFICDGIRVHNGGYRASYPTIGGSGGGGKKKKSKGIKETANNLFSNSIVSVLDLIGEGQIGGLVNGAKSVYLDNTVLVNEDGSTNFDDVVVVQNVGTQGQGILAGYSTVENPHSCTYTANVEKKITPPIETITDDNADAVRFVINFAALSSTNSKSGDIFGTSVTFQFEYNYNGGGWNIFSNGTQTVSGKTNTAYEKQYEYDLPKSSTATTHTWQIRVRRITDDHESSLIQDTFTWPYYVVITRSKLNYPNSAIVGVTVSAEQFSSIPSRSYLVDGLMIRVPSGYTPPKKNKTVRTSTGTITTWNKATYPTIWDGTFTTAVSSNPAWILLDLLTDTRYGLGNYITDDDIDVSALYKIAKYCDELVLDGYNYTNTSGQTVKTYEPRFQINTVIQQRTEAYSVISDICSAFRGMAYWTGGQVGFMADMPTDATMVFTPANVIDGLFTYQGSARKDRHSVCQVTWNNPDNEYQQEIEYVEDADLLDRYGIRETEMVDFGCTTRGQAHRAGLWTLYTEKYESDAISFDVGIDSALVLPGDVIEIHDTPKAGKRMGGRIKSCTTTSVVIDSAIALTNTGAILSLRMKDGSFVERTVKEGAGSWTTLTWDTELDSDNLPLANAIWLVNQVGVLEPVTARVVSVKQKDSSSFTITAVEHNPSKYDAIEKGLALEEPTTSIVSLSSVNIPTQLQTEEFTYIAATGVIGSKILVSWTGDAYAYIVSYRRVADGKVTERQVSDTTVTELEAGQEVGTTSEVTTDSDGVVTTTTTTITAITKTVPTEEEQVQYDDNGNLQTVTVTVQEEVVTGYRIVVRETVSDLRMVENWTTAETTYTNYEIMNVQSGWYDIRVQARSVNDNYSGVASIAHTVTGKTARPGEVENFNVRIRTYDLYLSWDEVTDIDIDKYEVRCGKSWDSAVNDVIAITKSNFCVHDQSEAGTYYYWIKSIDTSGNYSENATLYTLNLVKPASVQDFAAVQSDTRIDFKWTSNSETNISYYEIREGTTSTGGDGTWASGSHIADVMANSYTLGAGSVTGQRTFWIKAVASPGIYSDVAMFCRVNVTAPADRNVIVEVDEAEKGWTGNKLNTEVVAYNLELEYGQTYGEYVFSVDLGEKYTAQNSIVSAFDAVVADTDTWNTADYAWSSLKANRQWTPSGDIKVIDVSYYISIYEGYSKYGFYEVLPLSGDLNGRVMMESDGVTPSITANNAENVTYDAGRYLQGVKIADNTVVDWNINIPEEFNITFWYIPEDVSGNRLLWTGTTDDSKTLKCGMDGSTSSFYLTDSDGNSISVNTYYPQVKDKVLIGIVQTSTTRRLYVGVLNSGYGASSAEIAPIGIITNIALS